MNFNKNDSFYQAKKEGFGRAYELNRIKIVFENIFVLNIQAVIAYQHR